MQQVQGSVTHQDTWTGGGGGQQTGAGSQQLGADKQPASAGAAIAITAATINAVTKPRTGFIGLILLVGGHWNPIRTSFIEIAHLAMPRPP